MDKPKVESVLTPGVMVDASTYVHEVLQQELALSVHQITANRVRWGITGAFPSFTVQALPSAELASSKLRGQEMVHGAPSFTFQRAVAKVRRAVCGSWVSVKQLRFKKLNKTIVMTGNSLGDWMRVFLAQLNAGERSSMAHLLPIVSGEKMDDWLEKAQLIFDARVPVTSSQPFAEEGLLEALDDARARTVAFMDICVRDMYRTRVFEVVGRYMRTTSKEVVQLNRASSVRHCQRIWRHVYEDRMRDVVATGITSYALYERLRLAAIRDYRDRAEGPAMKRVLHGTALPDLDALGLDVAVAIERAKLRRLGGGAGMGADAGADAGAGAGAGVDDVSDTDAAPKPNASVFLSVPTLPSDLGRGSSLYMDASLVAGPEEMPPAGRRRNPRNPVLLAMSELPSIPEGPMWLLEADEIVDLASMTIHVRPVAASVFQRRPHRFVRGASASTVHGNLRAVGLDVVSSMVSAGTRAFHMERQSSFVACNNCGVALLPDRSHASVSHVFHCRCGKGYRHRILMTGAPALGEDGEPLEFAFGATNSASEFDSVIAGAAADIVGAPGHADPDGDDGYLPSVTEARDDESWCDDCD